MNDALPQQAREAAEIVEALLGFIAQPSASDQDFDRLALRLFAYQFSYNEAYRRFCQRRGTTIRQVRHWSAIPATPIDAFKDLDLQCQPSAPTDRVFMTSGTTRAETRGRNRHPTLAVYDRSMTLNFAQRFMRGRPRLRMAILFPDETVLPNSSLAHYLALALRHFGSEGSDWFMGADGLDDAGLAAFLAQAERSGEPCAVLGATYSFVHMIDRFAQQGRRFALPPGSTLLDTGGYKGQSRALPMDEFYDALSATLGVDRSRCINMYGMTELSTQFYDDGNSVVPSVKSGPHWIRSRLVDPVSGRDVRAGERGILVHCDLGNFNSVTTILTEDVGIAAQDGFLLLGRAEGAQAKGCSLAVEEFIRAASS